MLFLEQTASRYMLQGKISDKNKEIAVNLLSNFLVYAKSPTNVAEFEQAKGETVVNSNISKSLSHTNTQELLRSIARNNTNGFASVGKVLFTPTRATLMKKNKVVPMLSPTLTALAVFSLPEANLFIENLNKDIEFENEKVIQMDNVAQTYSEAEDGMISTASGLMQDMKLKGAISFTDFKTTFSSTKFQRGFYNTKEGDIYCISTFTARGNHSRVAARLVNYNYNCMNPAFGFIMPSTNRALNHHQAFFAYSINLANLSKDDGKLLGEFFVNQIKQARKKGGWKKHAELGKVGVDDSSKFR